MPQRIAAGWIRLGLLALPLYGLLTLWSTFTHQPDPNTDFEAYARYVSTTSYLMGHLFGSILGVTLAIFGAVALGACLSNRRSALTAMVLSVAGNALILTVCGMSTFATSAIGRAYLAGQQNAAEINQDILGLPLIMTALAGGLLYSAGTILFGVVIWRPRCPTQVGRSPLRSYWPTDLYPGSDGGRSADLGVVADIRERRLGRVERHAPIPG